MKRAIAISQTAIGIPGSEPFGAVIVRNGGIVGEGLSHPLASLDVTSHGEVEAIRDANRRLKRLDLSDCEIYTSCEPCPLCVAAIGMARLKKMYYAASRSQCGKAFAVLPPNSRFVNVNVDQLFADEGTTVDAPDPCGAAPRCGIIPDLGSLGAGTQSCFVQMRICRSHLSTPFLRHVRIPPQPT